MEQIKELDAPQGTFACPICGVAKPHHHPDKQVAAYRDDQIRGDGWTSYDHKSPSKDGWYLCVGIEVGQDQYGSKDEHGFQARERWAVLSWFKWVRDAAARHQPETEVPEVAYFYSEYGRPVWHLRNFLGNAVPSGAESRWPVQVRPKFWRAVQEAPKRD